MINHNQYIQDATRTESVPKSIVLERELLIGAMKMTVASAQILDLMKKKAFYRNTILSLEDQEAQKIADAQVLGQACALADDGIGMIEIAHHREERPSVVDIDVRLFHSLIGMSTESAELIEALLNNVDLGVPLDTTNLLEELGDLNWYQAIAIDALSGDLGKILDTNIAKLQKRYPHKFTDDAANKRNLSAEREVLEAINAPVEAV